MSTTQKFAGWCAALMIAVGLIGATIAALYVDKTKKFEEVAKGGICLATIALIGFFVVRAGDYFVIFMFGSCLFTYPLHFLSVKKNI